MLFLENILSGSLERIGHKTLGITDQFMQLAFRTDKHKPYFYTNSHVNNNIRDI